MLEYIVRVVEYNPPPRESCDSDNTRRSSRNYTRFSDASSIDLTDVSYTSRASRGDPCILLVSGIHDAGLVLSVDFLPSCEVHAIAER